MWAAVPAHVQVQNKRLNGPRSRGRSSLLLEVLGEVPEGGPGLGVRTVAETVVERRSEPHGCGPLGRVRDTSSADAPGFVVSQCERDGDRREFEARGEGEVAARGAECGEQGNQPEAKEEVCREASPGTVSATCLPAWTT